jgi:hypothetical protein
MGDWTSKRRGLQRSRVRGAGRIGGPRLRSLAVLVLLMIGGANGARAGEAPVHSVVGHGSIVRVESTSEGLQLTNIQVSIDASEPSGAGAMVYRPRVAWGAPSLIALNCVDFRTFSWTVPGGGLVRGHDVFASGSTGGAKRFIRLRVFDRTESTASESLLRDRFVVSPYRDSAPCGAPSRVGERFAQAHFRVVHALGS